MLQHIAIIMVQKCYLSAFKAPASSGRCVCSTVTAACPAAAAMSWADLLGLADHHSTPASGQSGLRHGLGGPGNLCSPWLA